MKTIPILITAVLSTAVFAVAATTVTTNPVGYVTGTCKANSDTIVSVPLAHEPEFVGTLSATATVAGDNATVVASGSATGWTANQFATLYPTYPTYYIKFKSGSLNGKYFTVTANGTNSLIFDTNGDTVTGAAAGDQFAVVKYWTLNELFPSGTQTTFAVSAGTLGFQRKSMLLLPDLTGTGIDLAPKQRFYITSSGWKNESAENASNQILYPDTYFIVRHPASVTTDTTFTFMGSVNTDRVVIPLSTRANAKQDNFVSLQRPIEVTLAESGLSSGFVASANTLGFNRKDTLLVFDNKKIVKSKAPSVVYYMIGSDWIEATTGSNANNVVLDPTAGYIVRKFKTTAGETSFWTNNPSY